MAKKKNKVIIPLVVLILIISVAAFFVVKTQTTGLSYSGQVLGISNANFYEDNQLGQAWRVYLSGKPAGESIVGYISKEDIGDLSGKDPEFNLNINIDTEQTLKYKVTSKNSKIHGYQIEATDEFKCNEPAYNPDSSWDASTAHRSSCIPICNNDEDCIACFRSSRYAFLINYCRDIYIKQWDYLIEGEFGEDGVPDLSIKSTLKLEAQGERADVVLDSAGQQSSSLKVNGQTYGYAQWAGNLESGLAKPLLKNSNNQELIPVYEYNWKYANKVKLDEYKQYESLNLDRCIDQCYEKNYGLIAGFVEVNPCYTNCIRNNEIKRNTILDNTEPTSVNIKREFQKDSTGTIVVEAEPKGYIMYQYPTLTLRVKAEWLGIKISKTKPVVQKLTSTACVSGETGASPKGKIFAEISNNYGESGAMEVWMTCNSPIQSKDSISRSVNIAKGSTLNLPFDYDANIGEISTGVCTVYAKDSQSDYKTHKSITVKCEPQKICEAGEKKCLDKTNDGIQDVVECNAQESGYKLVTECNKGCINNNGDPYCADIETCGNGKCQPEYGENTDNCPLDCDRCDPIFEIFGITIIPRMTPECISWWTPFIWIITILGAFATGYFTYDFASKRNKKAKNLNIIAGILFGLGVGLVIYLYWWAFLIILGILIILKIIFR